MSDHDPAGARPDFEGLEAWCRESRSWRIASATVLLLVGLGASAWAVSSGQAQLDPPTPLLFGVVLAATSLLPLAQALERSDWLRLVAALRGRWEAEDDPDARRRVAAGLERWIERLGKPMSELEQRLARIEAASRRRTLVVTVLLLGTTFAVLYLSTVAVTTARRERDEAVAAKRDAAQGRQRAIDSLHAVNEDSEQREQAAGMMHEEAVKLGSQQRAQEQEIDRLRRARDRLLDAIEKGRGSEAAVSVMLELVERHQAAQETAAARKWLDRALRLAPDDALAKELDAQLGGGGG